MERHITIEFGIAGLPVLHYRAEKSVADAFVADMRRCHPARPVHVDDFVTGEMDPLPCQQLFTDRPRPRRARRAD